MDPSAVLVVAVGDGVVYRFSRIVDVADAFVRRQVDERHFHRSLEAGAAHLFQDVRRVLPELPSRFA